MWPSLLRQESSQPDLGGLRNPITGVMSLNCLSCPADNQDYFSATAFHHLRHESIDIEHGAADVDNLSLPPTVRIDLPRGPERPKHARVVDHDRRRSEPGFSLLFDPLDIAAIRHVSHDGVRPATIPDDQANRLVELSARPRGHNYGCTFCGQTLGDCLAKSAAAARNHCDLVLKEIIHRTTHLLRSWRAVTADQLAAPDSSKEASGHQGS